MAGLAHESCRRASAPFPEIPHPLDNGSAASKQEKLFGDHLAEFRGIGKRFGQGDGVQEREIRVVCFLSGQRITVNQLEAVVVFRAHAAARIGAEGAHPVAVARRTENELRVIDNVRHFVIEFPVQFNTDADVDGSEVMGYTDGSGDITKPVGAAAARRSQHHTGGKVKCLFVPEARNAPGSVIACGKGYNFRPQQ